MTDATALWPSAHAVAAIVVAAAKETGEDPLTVPRAEVLGVSARPYALHALAYGWQRSVPELSRLVGYATPRTRGQLEAFRQGRKWDWAIANGLEDLADELTDTGARDGS